VTAVHPPALASPRRIEVDELLFDMDGTLVNSIPAVEHAWREWAREEGFELPDTLGFHGRTAFELVRGFVAAERVAHAVRRIDELESTSTQPIPTMPGALSLIESLPRDRWAIVTSASRVVAHARLTAGSIPLPDHLVTGSDVVNGKPDPEPFRLGRRNEGVAIAFEDTVAGLRSARGAGCVTVGIIGTTSVDELRAHADYVVDSLASVSVESSGPGGVTLLIASR
jgi:sugar-phosphatase